MSLPILPSSPPPASLSPVDFPADTFAGLYVHVPFCFHKCHYCDFYSITRQTPERMNAFVDRILTEAAMWTAPGVRVAGPFRTVFFGGGTPSLLPIDIMHRLIEGLKARLDLSQVAEWTIECNPATVFPDYCAMMRSTGVDRLSFGGQSFNAAELATLERHHNPDDVPRSIQIAKEAGFCRLNLDLIYAIPGQTLASWHDSLHQAIALETGHLSCYGLTYEPNTVMAVRKRLNQFVAAEESLELQMLHATRSVLASHGLQAYEISNYATVGQECQHNLVYWLGDNYLALGPSGASHVSGRRWRNRPHLGEWETAIDAGRLAVIDDELLTPRQRAGELAMLMLRLNAGINFSHFADRTGYNVCTLYAGVADKLASLGLISIDADAIRLTDKGLNVTDAVAGEFLL